MSDNALASLVGPLYGSYYLGSVMSTAFYGVTCTQAFFYFVHYQKDPLRVKLFVAFLWALNTIHEALCTAGVYKYIMAGLVNPLSFTTGVPDLVLLFLLTVLAALPTQGFFVYRIYILNRKNIVVPLIWVALAIVQLVTNLMYIGRALYMSDGDVHVASIVVLSSGSLVILDILCLSVAAGVDVLIAIVMTFLLIRERNATGIARTAHILQRLTVFAVNTGTWTATFALLTIVLQHVFPKSVYYAIFAIPLCSVYCNTVLANLNARSFVRGEGSAHNVEMSLYTSSSARAAEVSRSNVQRTDAKTVSSAHEGVWKTTEVVTFPDGDWSNKMDQMENV